MQFETELCSDMLAEFAIKVGSACTCQRFNERLYILTLYAAASNRLASSLLSKRYCPSEIRNYYDKHPSRIDMLDAYMFDNNVERYDVYVKQTVKMLDSVLDRFSSDSVCQKLRSCPERVKIAVWASILTPATVTTIYEQNEQTVRDVAETLTWAERKQLLKRILQYSSL